MGTRCYSPLTVGDILNKCVGGHVRVNVFKRERKSLCPYASVRVVPSTYDSRGLFSPRVERLGDQPLLVMLWCGQLM